MARGLPNQLKGPDAVDQMMKGSINPFNKVSHPTINDRTLLINSPPAFAFKYFKNIQFFTIFGKSFKRKLAIRLSEAVSAPLFTRSLSKLNSRFEKR